MKRDFITAAIAIVVFTVLLGVVYPLAMTGASQVIFPGNANGQKIYRDGQLVGSALIGQSFREPVYKDGKEEMSGGNPVTAPDPRYFQTRPSGTTPADNAAATTFANYGPNGVNTEQYLAANLKAYLQMDKPYDPTLTAKQVPVDAIDTSASGIDPDISQANAWIQAHRVAAVRHLPLSTVMRLISKYTGGRGLGFSGEKTVNVLELNLALDRLTGAH
ncbi:MAG TPA: potassium-transporting ATPase subunit C [Solirubrobacteraceae bacterium]|jgi:K+-transporting ATPase ATPase C chain|nr:potassium-transporting ATPase subunit C [Solirubrobacteraceae bacterium]